MVIAEITEARNGQGKAALPLSFRFWTSDLRRGLTVEA